MKLKVGRLREGLRWHAAFTTRGSSGSWWPECGHSSSFWPNGRGLIDIRPFDSETKLAFCQHHTCQKAFEQARQ